nr:Zn(II)2Cys6 transcription factor [Aspergillus niger CBS 513.88]|eukprot:XP_001395295.2 Zn(II)2Cys6 transcription factor [Aspergillus niger CBS 513.88]
MDSSRDGRSRGKSRGKYTTKACEECRRRRAKCDGVKPSCSRCIQWNVSCQYSGTEDGRRPASKSYVLLLRQRIESLEKLLDKHGINSMDHGLDEASYAMDSICESLKGQLSLAESLNFDKDGEMRYFGPTSGRLGFQGLPSSSRNSDTPQHNTPPDAALVIDEIPVSLQNELINLYFTWEQPWYPIVDETLFRESMSSSGRYWSPLLHYSILALGSRYSDSLDVRSDPTDPNSAGQKLLTQAKSLLHLEMEHPTLVTIQALGVIGMVYFAIGKDAAGWLHHGMADRLCLDMGLNMDPAGFAGTVAISARETRLRRQIYWTLYCHDKLSATYTGRICSMLDQQGAVGLPSEMDESKDNTETPVEIRRAVIPLQRALIKICQITEKILLSVWGPKPLVKESERPQFFESSLLALTTWFYDLPQQLRIDRPNPVPQAYTLHMIYHTTKILLAKPFLMDPGYCDSTGAKSDMVEKARTICRDSAKTMCVVAQKYCRTFGNFRRSPISAMHCTLSAARAILEEPDCPSKLNLLRICLAVLDGLSRSWHPARHIANGLRKLCPMLPSDVSPESGNISAVDLDIQDLMQNPSEVCGAFSDEAIPELHNILWTDLAPWSQLPDDYGYFDLLNQATWDRAW